MNEYRQNLLKEIGINDLETVLSSADWYRISKKGNLSEDFMREFKEEIYWGVVYVKQILSDDFLIELQDTINWTFYFMSIKCSYPIMKKFITKAELFYFRQFELSHFNEQQINELQRIIDLKYIFQKDKIKLEKTI